jgi:hypothetical protein
VTTRRQFISITRLQTTLISVAMTKRVLLCDSRSFTEILLLFFLSQISFYKCNFVNFCTLFQHFILCCTFGVKTIIYVGKSYFEYFTKICTERRTVNNWWLTRAELKRSNKNKRVYLSAIIKTQPTMACGKQFRLFLASMQSWLIYWGGIVRTFQLV